jgi:hypothetical protein
MRAEDLFEAMGGIDEELIARSDKRVRSSQKQPSEKKGGRKRSSVSRIYRFAVITMTTAAAVFLFLMVRDFVGSSRIPDVNKSQVALGEKAASAQSARGLEENDMIAEAVQAEEEAAADEAIAEAEEAAEEAVQEEEITRDTAEDWLQEGEKSAVDLLGELKGDYIRVEIISAEEEANGGSRRVPEYTEEGEEALSKAISEGQAQPAFIAATGKEKYYVYLTTKNGEEHKVTIYENAYVGIDIIPGVVMKISQADYEAVEALFR